jgi:hypothetical protein
MTARRTSYWITRSHRRGRLAAAICLLLGVLAWPGLTGRAEEPEKETPAGTNAPVAVAVTATNTPPGKPSKPATTVTATNVPGTGVELASFKIIAERNIFNPNRASRSSKASRATEKPKPVKTETFTLAGTMSYDKGDVAFFDSASSEYRKALKLNGKIAGHTITAITNQKVTLEKEGKSLELAVGGQLRRQDESPWELVPGSNTRLTEAKPGAAASSGDSGADNDIIKRMLQKREEELNK